MFAEALRKAFKFTKREVLRSLRVLACASALSAGTAAALAAQESEPYEAKSPETARRLSLLGTAAPIALGFAVAGHARGKSFTLLVGGIVLGPALGYVYAGETGRGIGGAGIRLAVLGVGAAGAVVICSTGDCNTTSDGGAFGAAITFLAAGVVVTTVLASVDIIRVGDRVRARNQRLAAVSVQPTYFPESRTAGLLVTWRH